MRKLNWIWLLAALMLGTGCGKKGDITAYMTAQEHFDYAMKFFHKKNYVKAQEQFSLITYKYSGSDIADDAQYYLAESYYRDKDYVSATSEYDRLISAFPKSEFVEDAVYKLALSYYELSPGFALDQKFTLSALAAAQNFLDLYPKNDKHKEIEEIHAKLKEKLARKEYTSATTYRKISEYEAAIAYYDFVINDYSDSPFVARAKYWKGYCYYRLKDYGKATLLLDRFIQEYASEKELVQDARELLEDIAKEQAKGKSKSAAVSGGS